LISGKGAFGVKRLSYSSIGLALSLGLTQNAMAQTSPTIEGNVLSLSLGADVLHDSNVAHASAQAAAQRGVVMADEKALPSADITFQRMLGRNKVGLTGSTGYQFYRRNTRLNREKIDLDAYSDIAVSSCALHLGGNYARGQSDLANLALEQNANVTNTQTTVGTSGNVVCGDEIGLRPTANISYQTTTNSQPQRKTMDRVEFNYGGGLQYAHPSLGTLETFVSRRETRFSTVFLSDGRKAGFNIMGYGGRFTRDIGSRMRGSVELRYVQMSTLQPGLPTFSGLNWSVDLTADLLSRVQSKLGASRQVITNAIAEAAYHVDRGYSASHDFAMNDRLHLTLSGAYLQAQYYGVNLVSAASLRRSKRYDGSLALVYTPSEKLQFNLTTGYTKRNANGTFYDYESFSVQTGFRVKI
jgi:hypothetical protein